MNKERRKQIDEIFTKLSEIESDLNQVADEERESFENMPLSIQDGVKGEAMVETFDSLENLASELAGLTGELQEIVQ